MIFHDLHPGTRVMDLEQGSVQNLFLGMLTCRITKMCLQNEQQPGFTVIHVCSMILQYIPIPWIAFKMEFCFAVSSKCNDNDIAEALILAHLVSNRLFFFFWLDSWYFLEINPIWKDSVGESAVSKVAVWPENWER